MKALLGGLAKKLIYVIAISIIFIAAVMTIGRSLRPVLNDYRPAIEKMASDLLQAPVTVNEVVMTWYQYHPGINLKRVTVLDKTGKHPVLKIKKIGIYFSIPKSIWRWQFVPSNMMLTGATVNLVQDAKGNVNLQGLPSMSGQPSETGFNDVIQWLSTQSRLILRDIEVHYQPNKGRALWVTLYDLSFKNDDDVHVILGKAILHQKLATDFTVAIQWKGNKFDLAAIKAKIYLYISGFSFSQWFSSYSWSGWHIDNGIGSAKIWATWNHNQFRRMQSNFQLYDMAFYSQFDKSTHKINRISGEAAWRREGDKQIFAGNDLLIDLPAHLWPVTSFYLSLNKDATGQLKPTSANIGYLALSDIEPYLFSTQGLVPDAIKKTLIGTKLNGELQNASVVFSGELTDVSKMALNAKFSEFKIVPWNKLPGMNHLSGVLKWNGSKGEAVLNSHHVTFEYDAIFTNPVDVDQLTGDIAWQQGANKNWVVTAKALQVLNSDLAANINGDITISESGEVSTDLKGNFSLLKIIHVARYLPLRIFDASLVTWMKDAFQSGEVKSGTVELKGRLADFPFDKKDGKFAISAAINNIDLKFAPDWPIMRKISGQILFLGRQIKIDVAHAQLINIPVANVHAEIPYLGNEKPQILEVTPTTIQTDIATGLGFVHASPLEKTIGHMFSGMEATGPIKVTLGLTVPLADTDKVQVNGTIALNNNDVTFKQWDLDLHQLNGLIHFTENTSDAKGVTAQLFNKPLQFDIATVNTGKNTSVVRVTYATHLNIADLEQWLKVPLSKVALGSTDVKGFIDLSLTAPIEVHLQSNLKGVGLDLPDGYAKHAESETDLNTLVIAQEKQPLKIKVIYGQLISAALQLNQVHGQFKLQGINLRVGGGDPAWPTESGVIVTGTLPELTWDKVKEYSAQTGNSLFSDYPLRHIDLQIGKVLFPSQLLTNVRLLLTPVKKAWDVQINSNDIVGTVHVPIPFDKSETLVGRFDRLNLQAVKTSNAANPTVQVKSLPTILLTANNFSYNAMPLGQLTLKTSPANNGADIQTLRIQSSRLDLQASGHSSQAFTELQGFARSSKVSDLVNSMGMDAKNFVAGNGELRFDLNWRGAFFAASLNGMNGSATLKLGSGHILDIGESSNAKMGIGRMLSIFSLQSIPRRLSLDFSDLVEQGYSFDSITGSFNLRNGNAFTENMQITGPVATVAINGRIGLSNQDYDFKMRVTPVDVTSSLPVAATLLTGPVGGIAALAVNTMVGSQISKAVTYTYLVKGPWSNPTWIEMNTSRERYRPR